MTTTPKPFTSKMRVTAPARLVEGKKVNDPSGLRQVQSTKALPEPAVRRGHVHLVTGPVGAGKSTFALGLARERGALRFSLDAWMTALFALDRPETGVMQWYVERAARCVEQIWAVVSDAASLGMDVILEIGLLSRRERAGFYRRVEKAGFAFTVHVLDASREVRRERVAERNRARGPTFSMVVPPDIFELASDRWEPPDALECKGRDVRFVRTD